MKKCRILPSVLKAVAVAAEARLLSHSAQNEIRLIKRTRGEKSYQFEERLEAVVGVRRIQPPPYESVGILSQTMRPSPAQFPVRSTKSELCAVDVRSFPLLGHFSVERIDRRRWRRRWQSTIP